ncbi:hypothetical protein MAR_018095, partial [Mya arenaria]
MTIRWKAPSLLERNSNIKEYVLKHNVGNITTNSGAAEQLQSLSFVSKAGNEFYSKEFDVIPETTYSIEEADATLNVVKEGSKDQTFISLNLVRDFFTEESNGRVQRTALL